MIMKQCARCGVPVVYPASYCFECAETVREEKEKRQAVTNKRSNKKYNSKRDPKYIRFYNSHMWRALSQSHMARVQYKCEHCGKLATEVHHVVPIQTQLGWDIKMDDDGLIALCTDCHNKEHGRFQKRTADK